MNMNETPRTDALEEKLEVHDPHILIKWGAVVRDIDSAVNPVFARPEADEAPYEAGICPACTHAVAVRDGCEFSADDVCDGCAQRMVAEVRAILARFNAMEKGTK